MNNYQMKILIVDDERSNLAVLSRILKPKDIDIDTDKFIEPIHSNYSLCVAKSGHGALKKAIEEKPDLILLDVIMPDMSGFEVLSKLKQSEITRKIPVIFITGLNSVEDEEQGFFLGAVDYITKPFYASLVRARIKTHLRIVEQMHTIERLGLIDTLTSLPNRRGFDNKMTTEWNNAIKDSKYISLLMIDIDRFKNFNDTYGHQQGDIVLQKIATLIKNALERTIDLAARWGGEEFAVILPDMGIDNALEVAETIRSNIESLIIPKIGEGVIRNITVSIGVACIKPNINSFITDFISGADKALYNAKETGRNKVKVCEMKG